MPGFFDPSSPQMYQSDPPSPPIPIERKFLTVKSDNSGLNTGSQWEGVGWCTLVFYRAELLVKNHKIRRHSADGQHFRQIQSTPPDSPLARSHADHLNHYYSTGKTLGMVSYGTITIQSYPKLAAAILFCLIVGSSGSLVTITGPGSWYAGLQKPFFAPPGWVFAPVWITLFILMGIALYLVWESGTEHREVRIALGIFGVQFFLNVIWSFLFFGLRSPLLGLIDIILLWLMIAVTIAAFYRVKKSAAYLLVPYIAWVTLASALNGAIYFMNP
jgi:translocator protein